MARFNFLGRAVDTYGNVKTSVGITIRLTGTTTPATVYNERTGGTGISTEPQITSDSFGRFNFYIDELDYPYAGNQKFDIIAGGLTYEDIEILRGVKIHSSLEELEDDDHPQYAALGQNEIIDGKWLFSHPVSGQAPTEDNHLTTKYYVQLQSGSISAASVEQDKREREATNVQIASVSAASVEQDKRGHAFTLSASASLYENLNTQIASVSAASVEADKRDRRWASDLFISTSAASVEQDKRDRRWATDLFISTSAASVEADRTHKIWADTMFASVSAASREQDKRASRADATHIAWAESMFASTSAASVEQDKRERAFTLSASASLYENLNTQIISVSAASVEQDKRDRRWATDLFISTSGASVEADRTHKIWADTMFASVSAASVEQDKRERAFTVSASASLYENLNTQTASVSAASVEQDKREREATNVQIASVSAASVEQDKREREATNVQIASVSAASVEQDNRLLPLDGSRSMEGNLQMNNGLYLETDEVRARDSDGLKLTNDAGAEGMLIDDTGNVWIGNGQYLLTDAIWARDSGGLYLRDDAGNLGIYIEDGGKVSLVNGTNINEFSIDGTLAGNSDDVLSTEKAVKTYSDNISAASVEQDKRLQANLDNEVADLNNTINTLSANKIVEGDSGVVVNDTGTGSITISADGVTIATFKSGNVGLGTTEPTAIIHLESNPGEPDGVVGREVYLDINPSGSHSSAHHIYGLVVDMDSTATENAHNSTLRGLDVNIYSKGDIGNIYGIQSYVSHSSTTSASVDHVYANYNQANIFKGSAQWLIGSKNTAYIASKGYGSIAYGSQNSVQMDAAGKTLGTGYASWNQVSQTGGTLDTGYLFYGQFAGTIGTAWGVYITLEDKNYFSGSVGIGEKSPGAKLDVDGDIILLKGVVINEFSNDGTLEGNSPSAVPTEYAVKTYSDNISAASREQDKRLQSDVDINTTQILSVSGASREQDRRLNETLRDYVDSQAGGEGFSNKIIEGDSGVTVNDEGTATINISADGDHLAQFKEKEIRLIPGADSTDRVFMGTPADKTGGYFEVGPSAMLSPSGAAPLQYNGYFYATKVYNAVWG